MNHKYTELDGIVEEIEDASNEAALDPDNDAPDQGFQRLVAARKRYQEWKLDHE